MNTKWLLFFIVILPFLVQGQTENSWTKKASFAGLKREKAVSFSIGNYGYISCGVDTAEFTHNDLWEYDPVEDSWTQKASIPASERKNAVAFTINNKGYVGTGLTLDDSELGEKLNDFWVYDPILNNWNGVSPFPGGDETGIYQATAFSLLEKGYVACGKIGPDNYLSELWQYNPISDEWIQKTSFPGGDRYQLVSFTLENKAFVGLGTDHDVFRKDIHAYDPTTNTWEQKSNFPGTERSKASTFSLGLKGFIVFGSDGGLKDELWEYNYYTESWNIRASFPGGGRSNGIAFSIEEKGYAGIGKGNSGKKSSFYEYAPTGPLSVIAQTNIFFTISPNPLTTQTQISLPKSYTNGTYLIQDITGKTIIREKFTATTFILDGSLLNKGTYLITLLDAENNILNTKKMVLL